MQNVFRPDRPADLSPASQAARDAALLRATTDLFVQELINGQDAIRRYEGLATHLLPRIPATDRAFVAERLAARLDAPQSVIRTLAKDDTDVACHVIRHSPVLEPLDLLTVIAATGPEHHRLIAERPGLAPEVEQALRIAAERASRETTDGGDPGFADDAKVSPLAAAAPSTHTAAEAFADAVPGRRLPPRARAERLDIWNFLGLDRAARLKVMADLATHPPVRRYSGPAKRLDRAFRTILSAAQIVGHARSGRRQELIEAITSGLELEPDVVVACLDDVSGEAAAVLLKALGLDNVQAQQVFLLATPTLGLDVNVFFRLADIYAGMETWVAEILVDAWRRGEKRSAAPRHEPHYSEGRTRLRPAAAGDARPERLSPRGKQASGG